MSGNPMFSDWANFYIMAGTAGATLIGLLFVVVTLAADRSAPRARRGIDAFLTPTFVHFCGVLMLAMAILVPWPSAWPIGILLGLCGLFGLTYQISIIFMKRRQRLVSLHWHDWIPHAGFPALGNVILIAGAVGLIARKSFAPFAIAGAVTLILIAGIYGAWDITLWIVRKPDNRD